MIIFKLTFNIPALCYKGCTKKSLWMIKNYFLKRSKFSVFSETSLNPNRKETSSPFPTQFVQIKYSISVERNMRMVTQPNRCVILSSNENRLPFVCVNVFVCATGSMPGQIWAIHTISLTDIRTSTEALGRRHNLACQIFLPWEERVNTRSLMNDFSLDTVNGQSCPLWCARGMGREKHPDTWRD